MDDNRRSKRRYFWSCFNNLALVDNLASESLNTFVVCSEVSHQVRHRRGNHDVAWRRKLSAADSAAPN